MVPLIFSGLIVIVIALIASTTHATDCPKLAREDFESLYVDVGTGRAKRRTFKIADDALNYIQHMHYLGTDVRSIIMFVNETMTQIENITVVPAESSDHQKRWSCSDVPLETYFTQRQVSQDGWWEGPWLKSSSCTTPGGFMGIEWLVTNSWSLPSNFDFGLASQIADAHFGFVIRDLVTKSGTYWCETGGHSSVSVWSQSQFYWADQQTQSCIRTHYGNGGCHCDAWLNFIHADIPVENRDTNLGCSYDGSSGC